MELRGASARRTGTGRAGMAGRGGSQMLKAVRTGMIAFGLGMAGGGAGGAQGEPARSPSHSRSAEAPSSPSTRLASPGARAPVTAAVPAGRGLACQLWYGMSADYARVPNGRTASPPVLARQWRDRYLPRATEVRPRGSTRRWLCWVSLAAGTLPSSPTQNIRAASTSTRYRSAPERSRALPGQRPPSAGLRCTSAGRMRVRGLMVELRLPPVIKE